MSRACDTELICYKNENPFFYAELVRVDYKILLQETYV